MAYTNHTQKLNKTLRQGPCFRKPETKTAILCPTVQKKTNKDESTGTTICATTTISESNRTPFEGILLFLPSMLDNYKKDEGRIVSPRDSEANSASGLSGKSRHCLLKPFFIIAFLPSNSFGKISKKVSLKTARM